MCTIKGEIRTNLHHSEVETWVPFYGIVSKQRTKAGLNPNASASQRFLLASSTTTWMPVAADALPADSGGGGGGGDWHV